MLAWLFEKRVPRAEYDAMKAHYEQRIMDLEKLVAQTVKVITAQMNAKSEDTKAMLALAEKMEAKITPDRLH